MAHENVVLEEKVITTVGDLVEAVTQIALEAGKSEKEGYELAYLTIERILRRKAQQQIKFFVN